MSQKYDLLSSATAPIMLRVIPELAEEIGLNPSLVLLQLTYWIRISDNEREGRNWTFQSLRGMKRAAFPFWSVMTIDRAIQQLVKRDLVIVRDDLNKRKGDNTRWFALNPDGLAKLHSISLQTLNMKRSAKVSQNETVVSQVDTPASQDVTTLPEITPETTHKESNAAPTADDDGLPDHVPLYLRRMADGKEPTPVSPDGNATAYQIAEQYCNAWDIIVKRFRDAIHRDQKRYAEALAGMGAAPDEVFEMCKAKRAAGKSPGDYGLRLVQLDYPGWKSHRDNKPALAVIVVSDEQRAAREKQMDAEREAYRIREGLA
jgi:hypothetical protein